MLPFIKNREDLQLKYYLGYFRRTVRDIRRTFRSKDK